MKPLIKVMLMLGLVFGSTFVIGRLLGILTAENIRHWLEQVQLVDPLWVAALVIVLLFIDLFVAVPTLTITILAGFFLGFPMGALSALAGVSLAALGGYCLSRKWGEPVLKLVVKSDEERAAMKSTFQTSGPFMIILARAAPMVPEITACMAGATAMPFLRYAMFFMLGTIPYVLIAAYAGSISSIESPQPAIFAALFLYAILWIGWYGLRRSQKRKSVAE